MHTQGSRMHRKRQSEGQAVGRGPQSGAVFWGGHTVPGQIADSFKGSLHWPGAIEALLGPATLTAQPLHPSAMQEETFTLSHWTLAQATAASSGGHTAGPCPSAQHLVLFGWLEQGSRKPRGSMLGAVETGRQVHGSWMQTSESRTLGSNLDATSGVISVQEKSLGH